MEKIITIMKPQKRFARITATIEELEELSLDMFVTTGQRIIVIDIPGNATWCKIQLPASQAELNIKRKYLTND